MNEHFCQVVHRCHGLTCAHTWTPEFGWMAVCRLHLDMIEKARNTRWAR